MKFFREFLVTDIPDECKLGMDFLATHDCELDLGLRMLISGNIEVPTEKTSNPTQAKMKVVLCDDVDILKSSKNLLWAEFGPDNH